MQKQEGLSYQITRNPPKNLLPSYYPFVKWAGGKTQLLPQLENILPSRFNRYFEPFLGGGAMFFHLLTHTNNMFTAYLSDANEELINAFLVVKNDVNTLIEILKMHNKEYQKNPKKYYYYLRDCSNPKKKVDRAAKFIMLNKTCFNGLYRVNKRGDFNVPIGNYKNPLICDSVNLRNVSFILGKSKAKIEVADYKKILSSENYNEMDFIYLDPPYDPTSATAKFTAYTDVGFKTNSQVELAGFFKRLHKKKCKILLSNANTPFIRTLYADFAKFSMEVKALRSINCVSTKRQGHKDLLIRNYLS
jgi:DNA adenine methylase